MVNVVRTTYFLESILLDGVSVTVEANGGIMLPETVVVRGVDVSIYGVLQGAASVVLDAGASLVLYSTSSSASFPPGYFNFSNVYVTGTSTLAVSSLTSLSISSAFVIRDVATVNFGSGGAGFTVSFDTMEMSGSASLSFTGSVVFEGVTSMVLGLGTKVSGVGGGFGSGGAPTGCPGGSTGSGGSNGGYGGVGSPGGTAMVPCSVFAWPSTMGAGGMPWGQPGGPGGSSIVIIVNATTASTLVMDGSLLVDGVQGAGSCSGSSGGGSGGSIAINASMVSGTGRLSANGASGGELPSLVLFFSSFLVACFYVECCRQWMRLLWWCRFWRTYLCFRWLCDVTDTRHSLWWGRCRRLSCWFFWNNFLGCFWSGWFQYPVRFELWPARRAIHPL